MRKDPKKWDRRKQEKTRWFRDALRVQQGDQIIEGSTRITKIIPSTHTRDELTVHFEGQGCMTTNLAYITSRETMEKFAIESLDCWLEGPQREDEWKTFIYTLSGIPQPKSKSLDFTTEEKPKPTSAAVPPPPTSPLAEVFEVGDSLVAIAIPPLLNYKPPQRC